MNSLSHKIDFVLFVSVKNANPNGDPLLGNMPRTDYEGYGEISDVAIKRKVRNRLQDFGYDIFVQANDRKQDEFKSLEKRFDNVFDKKKDTEEDIFTESCKRWIDVRSFGQVMTYQNLSLGIRGPVSISLGKSLEPVDIITMQITRSTNGKEPSKNQGRSSDTMGIKHFVDFGVYKITGSINCYFAAKTGFTDEDAGEIKKALISLFENDMSAARPEGSMAVEKVYWFVHPNAMGLASSAKIQRLVQVKLPQGNRKAQAFTDYQITLDTERMDTYQKQGLCVEELAGY